MERCDGVKTKTACDAHKTNLGRHRRYRNPFFTPRAGTGQGMTSKNNGETHLGRRKGDAGSKTAKIKTKGDGVAPPRITELKRRGCKSPGPFRRIVHDTGKTTSRVKNWMCSKREAKNYWGQTKVHQAPSKTITIHGMTRVSVFIRTNAPQEARRQIRSKFPVLWKSRVWKRISVMVKSEYTQSR